MTAADTLKNLEDEADYLVRQIGNLVDMTLDHRNRLFEILREDPQNEDVKKFIRIVGRTNKYKEMLNPFIEEWLQEKRRKELDDGKKEISD